MSNLHLQRGRQPLCYTYPDGTSVEELELDGAYYIIIWDEDHEYPAAIVKSEHEMYLIKGDSVFRAVQEAEYMDDILLQAF